MSGRHSSLLRRRLVSSSSPFAKSTATITTTCSTSSCRLTAVSSSSSTPLLSSSHAAVRVDYHYNYTSKRGYAALGAKGGAMPSPHSAAHFFVQFQETPNEECMKFFVEGQHFLLPLDAATIHRAAPIARKPVDITKKRVLLVKKKINASPTTADEGDTNTAASSSSSLHPHLRNLVSEDAFEGGSHHEEQYADEGYSGGVAASKAQMAASMEGTTLHPIPAATTNVAAARAMPMTMSFDKSNNFLSPLAQSLMEGCPMIEEVTVGHSFITVRRIPEDVMVERLIEAEAQEVKQVDLFKGAHPPGGKPKTPEEGGSACCTPPNKAPSSDQCSTPPATSQTTSEAPTPAAETKPAPEAVAPTEKTNPETPKTETPAPSSTDTNGSSTTAVPETPLAAEDKKEEEAKPDTPPKDGEVPVSESDEAKYRIAAHGALSWGELQFTVSALLMDHLFTGAPHITPGAPHPHPDTLPAEGDSEVMLVIKELVSDVIRPLVQQDGGDIRLVKFEPISAETEQSPSSSSPAPAAAQVGDIATPVEGKVADSTSTALVAAGGNVKGRVWVEMLGACKSCKSSKTTLKDLIERTIQHWVPEVHEVVEFDAVAKAKAQEEMKQMLQKAFEARRAASEAAAAAVAAKAAAASTQEGSDDHIPPPPQTLHEEEIPEMDLP